MAEQAVAKRIVLTHTQGRLAGLWRILGCEDDLPAQDGGLPAYVEHVDFLTHTGAASLVTTRRRYHWYRELMPPALNLSGGKVQFNPDQP